jgi:hypothetical protein
VENHVLEPPMSEKTEEQASQDPAPTKESDANRVTEEGPEPASSDSEPASSDSEPAPGEHVEE